MFEGTTKFPKMQILSEKSFRGDLAIRRLSDEAMRKNATLAQR